LSRNTRHEADFLTERNWRVVGALQAFAARRGRGMIELAFGWLLRESAVASVIAGVTSPAQIEQNVGAAGWTLSAEELLEIDRITS
jgi:aryl-alcohol dehydrogenase-like predicted oxidoreductase